MAKSSFEVLQEQAKVAGYDSVDEYLAYCEVLAEVKKMNRALDRAFLPDDLLKYCDSVDDAVFPK